MLWFKHLCGEEWHCEIAQGEPCDYFEHSDTYVFAGRDGVSPWFSRRTVEANPAWFEAEHNAPDQARVPPSPEAGCSPGDPLCVCGHRRSQHGTGDGAGACEGQAQRMCQCGSYREANIMLSETGKEL
jgi:hypothetical protein